MRKEVSMLDINSVNYKTNNRCIINNISTAFAPGLFSMIIGPNGSGKSTLLKIISGDIMADSGYVKYGDQVLTRNRLKEIAKVRATMSQHSMLTFPMSVEDVVMMGRYPHFNSIPSRNDIDICKAALVKLSIEHLKKRNYLTLSGGERQRVHFAKCLAQIWDNDNDKVHYLLLDEPIASLDPNFQHEFLTIAKELSRKNIIVVAVMHDINLASQYGDYFVALKEGEVMIQGTHSQVLNTTILSDLYQISFQEIRIPQNTFSVFVNNK